MERKEEMAIEAYAEAGLAFRRMKEALSDGYLAAYPILSGKDANKLLKARLLVDEACCIADANFHAHLHEKAVELRRQGIVAFYGPLPSDTETIKTINTKED